MFVAVNLISPKGPKLKAFKSQKPSPPFSLGAHILFQLKESRKLIFC